MSSPCEYLQCTYREDEQGLCCFEGKEESCPLWRDFSVKDRIRRHNSNVVKMVEDAMSKPRHSPEKLDAFIELIKKA